MKNLILFACLAGWSLAFAATKEPLRITPKQAQEHMGDTVTVCGKVVAARISKYSIANRGKPITFDLDEPEPNPQFFFVTWSPDPARVQETKEAYEGKRVCVTGKIMQMANIPHIIATELSQIEIQTDPKK